MTVYCYLLYCTIFIQREGEHPIEDEREQRKRGLRGVSASTASSQGRNPSPTKMITVSRDLAQVNPSFSFSYSSFLAYILCLTDYLSSLYLITDVDG